jgi:hypothetical protein
MTNWLAPWSRDLVEKLIVPAYQEVPHIVWKTFYYHLLNSPTLVRIANYIIQAYVLSSYFFQINFNIILLFCTWILQRKSFLISGSPPKTLCAVHAVHPMHATIPAQNL